VGVLVVTLPANARCRRSAASSRAHAATREAVEQIRVAARADKSLPRAVRLHVRDLRARRPLHLASPRQPVLRDLGTLAPPRAQLTLAALLLAVGIALPLGVLAPRARARGSIQSRAC